MISYNYRENVHLLSSNKEHANEGLDEMVNEDEIYGGNGGRAGKR